MEINFDHFAQVSVGSSDHHVESADIVSCDRLQGFSDAVFATAATLLIVPVRKFEHDNEHGGARGEGRLRDALLQRWQQFLVFIFGKCSR